MTSTKRRSKPKRKTDAQHRKILWKLFSEYVRRNGCDDQGFNKCFTCDVRKHWKQLHGGHYIRASAGLATYFDEQNVHPQCYACNIWRDGNSDEYALRLIRKYGENILNELNERKHRVVKDFPWEAEIERYQRLINSLPCDPYIDNIV